MRLRSKLLISTVLWRAPSGCLVNLWDHPIISWLSRNVSIFLDIRKHQVTDLRLLPDFMVSTLLATSKSLDPNHSTSWTQNKHVVAVVEFYDWQNINNTPNTLVYILSSNSSFHHFHSLLDDTGESKVCDLPWKKIVFFLLLNSRCKKKEEEPSLDLDTVRVLTQIQAVGWCKSIYIYK